MVVGITKTSSEIFLMYNSLCDTCVDYFLIFFFLFIAVSHSDCACDSWKLFATRIVKKCQSAPHISSVPHSPNYDKLIIIDNDDMMMNWWWWWWWWRTLTSLIPCGYYLTPSSCGPFWLNWPREKFSESCPVIPPLSSPPPPWPLPSYGEKHLPGKSLWLVSKNR